MRPHPMPACLAAGRVRRLPAPLQLCLALAIAFGSIHGHAQAQLPTGAQVVSGSANWKTEGGAMTVRNSPNAIIDWQGFSIGAGSRVRFDQADSSSQVLNRVVGRDGSLILGSLSSNGRVWLINPNGVLFGPGARVDVSGLVASSLNVSNADFLSRQGVASADPGKPGAAVVNQGQVAAAPGGSVWLLGASVRNEGLIQAPGGQILLAAGNSLEFVDASAPNVVLRVSAPENEAINLGTLLASGSEASIGMLGGIVNQQGVVRADSTGLDAAGRVVLRAQDDLVLGDKSLTSASAQGSGGQVVAQSLAGTTLVSGQVAATSSQGHGGSVHLLGQRVGVQGQALVDASGASAGGAVLVGGDYQGSNPLVPNARAAYVGPEVTLRADATAHGDGGKLIVWSDQATRVYGSLSARGGPGGGNGGLIETSGAYLDARPASVDATAHKGKPGTWLLDPNDILIALREINSNIDDGTTQWTTTGDSAVVSTAILESALLQGQNVVVRTGSAGSNSQAGDITVADSIIVFCGSTSACTPGSLTLQAHRDIILEPDVQITTESGAMPLSLKADGGSILIQGGAVLDSGAGGIVFQASQGIVLEAGARLSSSAPGDAIVLRSSRFDNQAGSLALNALNPSGRWLIHTDGITSTQLGGLTYQFLQFNVGPTTDPTQPSGNGVLYAEALDLQGSILRVYDGTAVATLDASTSFSGAPAGYQVSLAAPGVGSFPDKNVGTAKPVNIATAPVLDVKDAENRPVYGYGSSYLGDIVTKQVTVSAQAQDKVYDGRVDATLSDLNLTGAVAGDDLSVAASASFGDASVGPSKMVGVDWTLTGDDAGNYTLNPPVGLNASITPAPLTFTANPALGYVAQPLPTLSGSVSGFVAGESLQDNWSTSAGPYSAPGRYGITGSVPSELASNYAQIQAEGNDRALTLLADDRPTAAAQEALRSSDASIAAARRLAQPPFDALAAPGLLDLSALAPGQLFAPVRIGAMSQADLAGLLETRREFKRKLFADSISRLEIDPSLADVQPCSSAEEAGSGNCRITPEQVAQVQAERQGLAAAPRQAALPQIQRKIAVLFGINDYGDRRIPKLESAIPDVDAVARVLSASMGYEVKVLRNPGKADIVRTLNQLSTELSPSDSVLVYYAGHGYSIERQGTGYWIAADSPADDPKRWLSNHDIARLLAAYPARQLALVSDSCYSGAFARESIDATEQQIDAGEVLGKRSVVVLTSGGDEPVTDEGKEGHSIFAWNLMQSLSGVQGWTAGNSVFRQVQSGVTREFPQTPHYGAVTAAGHQRGGEYLFEIR